MDCLRNGAIVKEGLSAQEVRELAECEGIVRKGAETAAAVIRALETIRDKRLYKAEYRTFGAYLRKKWGKSDRHFRRLAAWLDVSKNLAADPMGPRNLNERQTRELANLDPATQVQVVQQARQEGDTSSTRLREIVSRIWDRLDPDERHRTIESEEDDALETEAQPARQVGGDNWKERKSAALRKLGSAGRLLAGIGAPAEKALASLGRTVKEVEAIAA